MCVPWARVEIMSCLSDLHEKENYARQTYSYTSALPSLQCESLRLRTGINNVYKTISLDLTDSNKRMYPRK